MPETPFRPVSAFVAEALARTTDLAAALGTARRLQTLWSELIPPPLQAHCRPVSYRNGRLVIEADSSVWAAALRHRRQALLRRLRSRPELATLMTIHVKVAPVESAVRSRGRSPSERERARRPGAARDPHLRAALERLLRR